MVDWVAGRHPEVTRPRPFKKRSLCDRFQGPECLRVGTLQAVCRDWRLSLGNSSQDTAHGGASRKANIQTWYSEQFQEATGLLAAPFQLPVQPLHRLEKIA